MTTPPNQPSGDVTIDASELRRRLSTEPSKLDPKTLFYKMGYEAAVAELQPSRARTDSSSIRFAWSHVAVGLAAGLLAFVCGAGLANPADERSLTVQQGNTSIESQSGQVETPVSEPIDQLASTGRLNTGIQQGGVLATLEFVSGAVSQRGFTLSAAGVRLQSPFTEDEVSTPALMTGLRADSLEIEI